jgi:hypothetical protein
VPDPNLTAMPTRITGAVPTLLQAGVLDEMRILLSPVVVESAKLCGATCGWGRLKGAMTDGGSTVRRLCSALLPE